MWNIVTKCLQNDSSLNTGRMLRSGNLPYYIYSQANIKADLDPAIHRRTATDDTGMTGRRRRVSPSTYVAFAVVGWSTHDVQRATRQQSATWKELVDPRFPGDVRRLEHSDSGKIIRFDSIRFTLTNRFFDSIRFDSTIW